MHEGRDKRNLIKGNRISFYMLTHADGVSFFRAHYYC